MLLLQEAFLDKLVELHPWLQPDPVMTTGITVTADRKMREEIAEQIVYFPHSFFKISF